MQIHVYEPMAGILRSKSLVVVRQCLLVLGAMWLVACASSSDKLLSQNWPQMLPPLGYFQCLYHSDPVNQRYQSEEEYLGWIRVFYQGSLLYPTGWLDVEDAILVSTLVSAPAQERRPQQARLQELGAVIAAEWARDNDVRLIDNRLLSLWGSTLQLATDGTQLTRYIDVIAADIEGILARQLDPAAVNPRKYEESLQIPRFEDF